MRRTATAAVAAFVAALAWLGLTPSAASAGSYTVWECGGLHGGPLEAPDLQGPFGSEAYNTFNFCSDPGLNEFGVGIDAEGAPTQTGQYRAFEFFAPSTTYFASGSADLWLRPAHGDQPRASIGNGSTHLGVVATSTGAEYTHVPWNGGPGVTQFTLWMQCDLGSCAGSEAAGYARNFVFNLVDTGAPGVAIGGQLASSSWRNSGGTVSVNGSDAGGGVATLDISVNGAQEGRENQSCATTTLFGSPVARRFTPCPTSATMHRTFPVTRFDQGPNSLRACAYDHSDGGARNGNCRSTTVNIDTVAPADPGGLALAGGEGWRSENDFDVSWSNAAQPHAPIEGAMYRITRNGGGYDSGAQFVSGNNRQSLEDLSVPSPGEYTLRVWTRDAAGNHSEANARTAALRFDPTAPPATEALFNGWIRRNDFPYEVRWDPVAAGDLGPSGLDGYAVRITRDPDSDPCVTDDHSSPTCSPEEITNDGIGDTSMPVQRADVSEGEWYVHVAPVTGGGVKGAVEHTAMPVDVTDPASRISGADGRWTNGQVTVSVSASDEGAGMAPDPGYAVDPQPRTCLQLDGGAADCEPDDTITRVVSGEGEHRVSYFARDLAGNENDGRPDALAPGRQNAAPGSATVRIDRTGPRLAFANRTVDDPGRVVVNASDELSGLAEGSIQLRRHGSTADWLQLSTDVGAHGLSGRVPDDLDPGTYEFRATARDKAGNTGSTGSRADGTPMVEELPLKEAVNLTAQIKGAKATPQKGRGKCRKAAAGRGKKCRGKGGRGGRKGSAAVRVTIPYGRSFELSGHLQTSSDAPLRGRELEVTERMAEGAAVPKRVREVRTDHGGAYSLNLPAGPSRTISVRFAGETRYRPTVTDPVDAAVRSKVLAFKAPRKIPEKRTIRFRGRVGMDGVDLGAGGKRVELQYEKLNRRGRRTGKWATIDSDVANGARGAFRARYPLRSDYRVRTRVRFRALVPPERGWPYAGTATSRVRSTVILP